MNRRCRWALVVVSAGLSSFVLGVGPLVGCIDVSGLEATSTSPTPDADPDVLTQSDGDRRDVQVTPFDGGSDGEVLPLPGKGIRCGATSCQGAKAHCCFEGAPHCVAEGEACNGTLLVCDDRDDCPLETPPPVMPIQPYVCCLRTKVLPEQTYAACVPSSRCVAATEETLCDPALGDQCGKTGFGACTGSASLAPYKSCK